MISRHHFPNVNAVKKADTWFTSLHRRRKMEFQRKKAILDERGNVFPAKYELDLAVRKIQKQRSVYKRYFFCGNVMEIFDSKIAQYGMLVTAMTDGTSRGPKHQSKRIQRFDWLSVLPNDVKELANKSELTHIGK